MFVLCFPIWIYGTVDWHKITEEIYFAPEAYELKFIAGGASNRNYRLSLEESNYFIRMAPRSTELLGANIEVEYKVLQSLCGLQVAPEPVYFNKDKKILIMDFIRDDEEIDLLDPKMRRKVIALLHQIEDLDINVDREYKPYRDILNLVETVHSLGESLPEEFSEVLLPALKEIDGLLPINEFKKLCHLDLHHKNILKSGERVFIIDWEYATMCDPFLTLGSMASIERWNDRQMEELVKDYTHSLRREGFYRLYLYRIIADIHWVVWNHIQTKLSTIDRPYAEWEKLFLEAALERIRSSCYLEAITYFKKRNCP